MEPLLRVKDLHKHYKDGRYTVHAVNGVNFDIFPGEAVGLVGESGCGKSTTARCILMLEQPTHGKIIFKNQDLAAMSEHPLRSWRRFFQIVFQDPNESLNPRFNVKRTLKEPLFLHGLYQDSHQLGELMKRVTLEIEHLERYPHQLSGGQKQRVGIARAISTSPDFVVLDEPTSSLDMSLRIHILSLLRRLQREMNMAYLFISHDLSTVHNLCNRVLVMYLGRIIEMGTSEDVFNNPQHIYTRALLSAIPIPDPAIKRKRILLQGETPNSRDIEVGCSLQKRCPYVRQECSFPVPYTDLGKRHLVACVLAGSEIINGS
ncbi:MAG: ABC transporter ATP-binding protein [Anaerolineales bacterium]|nr:ABC transporter ATP-binding protein [Anaerolineales bacterium]